MKKSFFAFLAILFIGTSSAVAGQNFPANCYDPQALSACNPCDAASFNTSCNPCDPCSLFKKNVGCGRKSLWDSIEIDGWIQAGVYANSRGATTRRERGENYKGREVSSLVGNSGNGELLSTVHTTDFQVNQVWLNAYKVADGKHGFDWGFRSEIFFGPEAWFYQSANDAKFDYGWQDGDYYTAIPQLFVELAYGDWSAKVGKFETPLGYESMRAPDWFFYSHSHMFMMEPSTHSGVLAEYSPNDRFNMLLGYTTGIDASFENKYDDHGFLGYVSYQFTDKLHASYGMHYSRFGGDRFYPNGDERWFGGNDTFLQVVILTYDISKKMQYAIQWNWADAKDRTSKNHRVMYGIANYLTYQLNKKWGIGLRAEWTKDGYDPNYGGGWVGYYDGEVQEYTIGLNWKPYENISIRPEVRYDRCSEPVFNYGKNRDQFSGGVCGVVSF